MALIFLGTPARAAGKNGGQVVSEVCISIEGRFFDFGISGHLYLSLKPFIFFVQNVKLIVLKRASFFFK